MQTFYQAGVLNKPARERRSPPRAEDGEGQTGAMELLYMAEARVRPETRRRTPEDENYENDECQQKSEVACLTVEDPCSSVLSLPSSFHPSPRSETE